MNFCWSMSIKGIDWCLAEVTTDKSNTFSNIKPILIVLVPAILYNQVKNESCHWKYENEQEIIHTMLFFPWYRYAWSLVVI